MLHPIHIAQPGARVSDGEIIRHAVDRSVRQLAGAEVRYWAWGEWAVLEQVYDLPDVYASYLEINATTDTTVPIYCPLHDLYGFYVLGGAIRIVDAGTQTVVRADAGYYRLSYLPAAVYTCHFAAGVHHLFYFVPKDTMLFREPSPELWESIAPVEALRARLAVPAVSASLSMAGVVADAIRGFLRHPGSSYLRRYIAIQVLAITLLLQACEALCVQRAAGQVGLLLAGRMRSYIDEQVADGKDVDTASVARGFAVSYAYAKVIFRTHVGQPIGGYIRGGKLEQARRMLEAGDPPAQVARYICWTPAHFSRAFRARYGYPPGQHGDAISS